MIFRVKLEVENSVARAIGRPAASSRNRQIARAGETVPASDDPPEFAAWISALLNPRLPKDERDDIMAAIYDLFDPARS